MGAGHVAALHVPGTSALHRLPPECKVAAAAAFVVLAVATPRRAVWAHLALAAVVAAVAALGRVPAGHLLRRLAIEAPFVAFALALPFVTRGPRVEVLGVALSEPGLWAAWGILAKATLGVATLLVLAATTDVPALLRGLGRLHVPATLTTIAAFMVRYLDVVAGEVHRMTVARRSRAADPGRLAEARAVASSVGTLFVRSYERGERVHLAMVSRGYAGAMPDVDAAAPATARQWVTAMAAPAAAAAIALAAWAPG